MLGDRVTTGRLTFAFLTSMTPLAAMAGGLTATVLTAPALGQMQNVTPYYAFVSQDKTTVRCGSNDRFYKVGELTTGQIVLVDGEGESWSRISYPANLSAFVRAEDVKVEGTNATLTTASKLKAANIAAGFQGSWKSLFDTALPAGTTLKVIEPAKEGEGVVGYKIAAPDSARAFVETRALRHATDAEVEGFKSKGTGAAPAVPASAPNTTTPTTGTPTAIVPTTTTPNTTTTGTTPGVKPIVSTTGPEAAKPTTDGKTVASKPEGGAKDAKTKAEERQTASLEALENTMKTVWKQPVLTSEVGELMAEVQRAMDKEPADSQRRKTLQGWVNALKLRVEVRDKVRKQEEARAAIDKEKIRMAEEITQWEQSRVYTIVGELQASTVYDGQRLPQMYRVVSVGGTSRTLGYLKASDSIDMNKMLGQVIGVIGDASMDRSLMLNIITPVKIDTLKVASDSKTGTASTDAQPKPATATVDEPKEEVPAAAKPEDINK
jgi:hypothetical protein